jgi:hypothetical protein
LNAGSEKSPALAPRGRIGVDRKRKRLVYDLVVIEIDEQLVVLDRTADRCAEIVIPLETYTGIEETPRVEKIVLKVFVSRAVELVRTALADLVEHSATDAVLR